MKKAICFVLVAIALTASGMANALDFETLAGSKFVRSFEVTPSGKDRLILSVSGQDTHYSELSFEILSGGPRIDATLNNRSLVAAFNDRSLKNSFSLDPTPYTLQITGITKAEANGKISITTISGSVFASPISPVPEPETFAMLLAGLGVIGAFARRRSRPISPNGL